MPEPTRDPAAAQVLRKALSDLADSATRGATGHTKGLAEEMAIINPAYGGALDALAKVEQAGLLRRARTLLAGRDDVAEPGWFDDAEDLVDDIDTALREGEPDA